MTFSLIYLFIYIFLFFSHVDTIFTLQDACCVWSIDQEIASLEIAVCRYIIHSILFLPIFNRVAAAVAAAVVCCSCYIYYTKEILACGAVYAFIYVCVCVPRVCGIACAFPNQCHNELNPIKAGTRRIHINIIGRMPRGCEEKNGREANFTVRLVITRVTYNIYQKKNLAAGARTRGVKARVLDVKYIRRKIACHVSIARDLIPPPPLPLAMGFATENEVRFNLHVSRSFYPHPSLIPSSKSSILATSSMLTPRTRHVYMPLIINFQPSEGGILLLYIYESTSVGASELQVRCGGELPTRYDELSVREFCRQQQQHWLLPSSVVAPVRACALTGQRVQAQQQVIRLKSCRTFKIVLHCARAVCAAQGNSCSSCTCVGPGRSPIYRSQFLPSYSPAQRAKSDRYFKRRTSNCCCIFFRRYCWIKNMKEELDDTRHEGEYYNFDSVAFCEVKNFETFSFYKSLESSII
uniref:Uncharacterized protein n=1 Tax=Trichogramma kaykai TaxID=54128 RepID=A0ABD2XR29_9HYME